MERNMLTTQEVMGFLDVSRYWINLHLRQMGVKGKELIKNAEDVITIIYNEREIIDWINRNARFSRQTYYLDLCAYMSEEKAQAAMRYLRDLPRKTMEEKEIYKDLYKSFLEENVSIDAAKYVDLIDPRKRGNLRWEEVKYRVTDLRELLSINRLKNRLNVNSNEICYRYIYERAAIRCEIEGRTYYIFSQEDPEYGVIMAESFRHEV